MISSTSQSRERIRAGFINGWSKEAICGCHRGLFTSVKRSVVVGIKEDCDAAQSSLASISHTVAVFITEGGAIDHKLAEFMIGKRQARLIVSIEQESGRDSARVIEGRKPRLHNFTDRVIPVRHACQRIIPGEIRDCLRLTGIFRSVGVDIRVDEPAFETRLRLALYPIGIDIAEDSPPD